MSLKLPPASATQDGVVSTGAQTIAGIKTFSSGIQLPTTGGTSATLDYYEEASGTFSVTSSAGTGSATASYKIVRVGKQVTLLIEAFNITLGGTVGFLIGSSALPSRFAPSANTMAMIGTKENGSTLAAPSGIAVYASGRIDIYKTLVVASTFVNGVAGLPDRTCITYTLQ